MVNTTNNEYGRRIPVKGPFWQSYKLVMNLNKP